MSIFAHCCPDCDYENEPRYKDINTQRMFAWYVCTKCRHSFRCAGTPNGTQLRVTAESPYTQRPGRGRVTLEVTCST